ncbi:MULTISPECIES: flagellar motor switch protein FliM [unclassified Cobetia]|uniref:flagellar motor switch protein FliM n=1 Tax=unclassified Cobetia TaxID=2609414 RepID=UPI002098037E|nr:MULTISPECIES: flagellar motor switch protein FliM [unclassified Cobetia]MCO7233171.1 flagellar motor switch protein FliM [Cobetia sp. Dlab-2-AX]MCO7236445.1 flagellar motor switch protein FliM [Cobetia sp. Dlab-2-U]
MAQDDLLSQDEIDALLSGVNGDSGATADASSTPGEARIRPFDPASQHRIIRDRLHALDIINSRFSRQFRMGLFNLIRRGADITTGPVQFLSYNEFSRNVPAPTNINLFTMKPLRGTSMLVFPPSLVFMVVDSLFGGDGRFVTKSEGREFTRTEQRVIQRLMQLALNAYRDAWSAVYAVETDYLRSEMQVKFANITSSPNEIVVCTSFHLEVGNHSSDFQICLPYSMIEPHRELLSSPLQETSAEGDSRWGERLRKEVRATDVELHADFASITTTLGALAELAVGDVLPIEKPERVNAYVNNVPVLEAGFGRANGHRALRVTRIINHPINTASEDSGDE